MPPSVRYFSMRYRRAADSRGAAAVLMQANWAWHWLARGAERRRRPAAQREKNACGRAEFQLPRPDCEGFGAMCPGVASAMTSHTTADLDRPRRWTFRALAVATGASRDADSPDDPAGPAPARG